MKEAKKLIEQALRFPVTPSKKEYVFFKKDGVIYSVGITDIVYAMSKKGAMTFFITQLYLMYAIPNFLSILF